MDLNGDGRIQHAELKEFVLSGEFANAVAEASPLDSKSLDKLLGTSTRSTGGGGGEAPAPAAPAVAEAPAPAAV
jgi:hypothetical protein